MKRKSSPAQKLVLEYGQELRFIRAAIGLLKNVEYRLIGYLPPRELDFDKIGTFLERAAKIKYEAARKKL